MDKKVSIIVPVYKTEKLLHKCVDSIISQTYGNIEIILVDDGSPDACGKICDEYAVKDDRIRVIHKENGGQSTARNAALDICCGDYIMFVDSDDTVRSDAVESMLSAAMRHGKDIALCYAAYYNGFKITEKGGYYKELTVVDGAEALLSDYFYGRIPTAPWGKLFARGLFDNIRFPEWRAREDYAIMHRLFGASNGAVHCAQTLYVQYVRPGSTEYSAFNLNKLKVLDCDRDIKEYVRIEFPNLFDRVMCTYADALRNCMADICSDGLKRKYFEKYGELENMLADEILLLDSEGCQSDLSSHRYAIEHPRLFAIKHRLIGITDAARRWVKMILKGKKQ